jgi:hypothetical protein
MQTENSLIHYANKSGFFSEFGGLDSDTVKGAASGFRGRRSSDSGLCDAVHQERGHR